MPANVELTRSKVQKFLTALGPVTIDADGDYSLRAGSARVFVGVSPHPNGESTLVRVFSHVVEDVPLTPELYEFVATDWSMVFGTLVVVKRDGGKGAIIMRETLLGDFIDAEELEYAVLGIAFSTDAMDNKLVSQFGGTVFHPDAS